MSINHRKAALSIGLKILMFVGLGVLVLLPLLFYFGYYKGPFFPKALDTTNSDWLSFSGSYYGGLVGGLATFFAVYFTLRHERHLHEAEKQERILADKLHEKNDRIKQIIQCLSATQRALSISNLPNLPVIGNEINYTLTFQECNSMLNKLDNANIEMQTLYHITDNPLLLKYLQEWGQIAQNSRITIAEITHHLNLAQINETYLEKLNENNTVEAKKMIGEISLHKQYVLDEWNKLYETVTKNIFFDLAPKVIKHETDERDMLHSIANN